MNTYNLEKEFCNIGNLGSGLKYNIDTNKFDVDVDFSILSEHLVKITYNELIEKKNVKELLPGVFYRITDYEFTSIDPEVISAGHRFDIIVLALSEDMLSEDARAIQHEFTDEEKLIYSEEEQHYFDNSNLAAWKLKYSLDGNSKRFAWAPTNKLYGINICTASGNYVLYRNINKDEGIYYAFSNDNYTYYTTSEEPVEGDLLYEKKDGLIKEIFCYKIWYNAKQILIKSDYSDSYYLAYLDENDNYVKYSDSSYMIDRYNGDGFNIINHNYDEYIVVNENYNYIDNGTTKTGILVTKSYSDDVWLHNGNSFYVNFPQTFTDYITSGTEGNPFSESYTFTFTKLPEIGDTIEVTLGGDSYVPYTHITAFNQDIKLNNEITYVKDYTKIISTIPKNTTYRGTIYGMVDEYENDCEYDFKNALITGKYSLFDPLLFYYTFTNQGSGYAKLKDGDTYVLLNPGTYTFLGCMPFRLYEEPNYITYVLPIITDEGYDSWDFYAALTDEEELDPETGETLYKVDMFVMPGFYGGEASISHLHLIKVFEDRKWYVKELLPNDNSDMKYILVFSKDLNGNVTVYDTQTYYGYTKIFGEYLKTNKAWIYDACFKDNEQFQDFINLNVNSYFPFDIIEGLDNYATSILYNDGFEEIKFVVDSYSCYGIYYQYSDKPYTIKWLKQGFPISVEGDGTEFTTYEGTNTKFTNTVTITEPMYVYIKDSKLLDSWLDAYVAGDIVLSSDETLEVGQTVYDLYTTARDGEFYEYVANIVTPLDTSCAYSNYGPDCYRVTLRSSYFESPAKQIPKVVMDDVRFSTIEAGRAFLQDCYCVKARNGYHWEHSDLLFLKNVCFSNLQDANGCIIEDCYFITMEASLSCTIKDCSNTHIFNGCEANITSVADSMLENINYGNLCHIAKSRVTNTDYSNICGIVGSTISNIYGVYIINNNSYGNVGDWDHNYKNIYINGLKDKTITLSDILDGSYTMYGDKGHCVHIRSEEDLTITV